MTDKERLDLNAIDDMCKAASSEPWKWFSDGEMYSLKAPEDAVLEICGSVYGFGSEPDEPDSRIIAQSRTLIPALVAELRASRARVAELEAERDSAIVAPR